MKKKLLALLLAVLMVIAIIPMTFVSVSAEEIIASSFAGTSCSGGSVTNGVYYTNSKNNNYTTKTYSLFGYGTVTMSFKMNPCFGASTELLSINGVSILKSLGSNKVSIAGTEKSGLAVASNSDSEFATIVITYEPKTGLASFDYSYKTDAFVVEDIDLGKNPFEFTFKLGSAGAKSDSKQRFKAKDLSITQVSNPTVDFSTVYSGETAPTDALTLLNTSEPIRIIVEGKASSSVADLDPFIGFAGQTLTKTDADEKYVLGSTTTAARKNYNIKFTYCIYPETGDVKAKWIDTQYTSTYSYTTNYTINPITDKSAAFTVGSGFTVKSITVEQLPTESSDVVISASSVASCDPSDTIEIIVSAANNADLATLTVEPSFDTDTFEIVSAEMIADNEVFTDFVDYNTEYYFEGNNFGDGDFLKITLKVKDTAVAGDYDFDLILDDVGSSSVVAGKGTIKVNAIDYSGAIAFEGYQKRVDDAETYSVRFVVSGNVPKIGRFDNIGFKVWTVGLSDGDLEWDITTTDAYLELSDEYEGAPTAASLKKGYVSSLVLTGIPIEIGDVNFHIKPYTVIDGVTYEGTEKNFTTSIPYTLFENDFSESIANSGETAGNGVVINASNQLEFAGSDDTAIYQLVVDNFENDKVVTIKFDLYPNWSKQFWEGSKSDADAQSKFEASTGAPVLTVNGDVFIINRGLNHKSQYIEKTIGGGDATITLNSKTMVTITLDPKTGKGTIFVDQSLASNNRPNINKSFTVSEFTSLTLDFGYAENSFKIDNLVVTQAR